MTAGPDEGGDAACWLDRVCPECGAFQESAGACWRCGAATQDREEG